jgi:hypothetical protein
VALKMNRVMGILIVLLLLAFALPSLLHIVMALIIPMIVIVFILGLGVLLFQRRRLW